MSENRTNITFIILGAVMLVVAVPLSLVDWNNVKGIWMDMSNPASFKLTEGRVVSSSTYTSMGRSKTGYRYTVHHFSIEYEFTVDGKSYRSDNVTFSGDVAYPNVVMDYIRKYPVGKTVTVYYNPHNPSLSVLEPKEKGFMPMIFLGFLIISVLVFVLSIVYWLIRRAFFPKKPSPLVNPHYDDYWPHRDG